MSLRCLSLALLLMSFPVQGKELRVCADPQSLPHSHRDGSGFENRIARLAAEALHASLVLVWHPQQRGFARKTEGVCEVWMGVPSDFGRMLTTRPYYRSAYVFLSREGRAKLERPRVGVQLPGEAFPLPGAQLVGYPVYGAPPAAARMADDIAAGRLDGALVWGPQAGFHAARNKLTVEPTDAARAFAISIGVRHGASALRDALDDFIVRSRDEIEAILDAYAVPRMP